MNPLNSDSRFFTLRTSIAIIVTVVLTALVSGTIFYIYIDRGLGTSYAQRIGNLSIYKSVILWDSLIIYILFAVISFFAVIFFGVYYSHKITGPLYRLRMFAKEMANGNFGAELRFRSGDVIHDLSKAGNDFSKSYGERYSALNKVVDDMRKDTLELEGLIKEGNNEGIKDAVERINAGKQVLVETLSGVKL